MWRDRTEFISFRAAFNNSYRDICIGYRNQNNLVCVCPSVCVCVRVFKHACLPAYVPACLGSCINVCMNGSTNQCNQRIVYICVSFIWVTD